MAASNPTTATQLILLWTLLGFLLIWMLTFAILALRPDKKALLEDMPAPSRPVPAFPIQSKLHQIASKPLEFVETSNAEPASEVGTVPVT